MDNLSTSFIRTITPYIAGAILGYLTTQFGLEVPEDLEIEITAALTTLFGAIYYVVARYLETKFPRFSLLLSNKQPTYRK